MARQRISRIAIAALVAAAALSGCTGQAVSEQEQSYRTALQSVKTKHYPQAIGLLSSLGKYKDAERLAAELRYIVNGDYIGVGNGQVAAVKEDGSIAYYGGYSNALRTDDWLNITAVSTRGEYVEALASNGHIQSSFNGTIDELEQSTLNSVQAMIPVIKALPALDEVAAFQSYYPSSVTSLRKDGKVQILGWLREEDEAAVRQWHDIVAVTNEDGSAAGLRSDGTIVSVGDRYQLPFMRGMNKWQNVVAISTYPARTNTLGLLEDGTVVAAGDNQWGEGNVESWTDMIAIAAGAQHSVGLRRDGTVVATGFNEYGQCNVMDWTDVTAIDASFYLTIGLKKDGTLLIAGDSTKFGGTLITQQQLTDFTHLLVPEVHIEG